MTADAFTYAQSHVAAPRGRALWLYGDAAIASGDVYYPMQDCAQQLQRKGCTVFSDIASSGRNYDAVFVNCPKQREETEGLLALALERSSGFVMMAARADAGGSRLLKMMQSYGVAAEQLSKRNCKVVWTHQATKADRNLIERNLTYLSMRQEIPPPAGGRSGGVQAGTGRAWWTVPGLFGWNKTDPGSQLLLAHLPALSGRVADFGCGYGYLCVMLARMNPALAPIDAYDVDARAVACTARNGGDRINAIWQDIRALPERPRYDAIVMNPPFHSGKQENMALGQNFITKAFANLVRGGQMFLVANRHLPYEKMVPGLTILYEGEGYKIITGRAP